MFNIIYSFTISITISHPVVTKLKHLYQIYIYIVPMNDHTSTASEECE